MTTKRTDYQPEAVLMMDLTVHELTGAKLYTTFELLNLVQDFLQLKLEEYGEHVELIQISYDRDEGWSTQSIKVFYRIK